jgi:hypothetical protein
MLRLRYRGSNELSPGLHATAERDGRRTTVYLLDGMTAGQRRSALRRLRLTARMGHCPRLPAAQLAFALADPGGLGGGFAPRQLTQPGRGSSGRTPALAAGGGGGGTSAGSGSGGTSGGTTLSGGANPSPVTPRQSTPATSAPAPAPASTTPATAPAQSGSGSSSGSGSQGSGVCVNVGPLGVCLNI